MKIGEKKMILNKSKKIMVFALILLLSTFVLPTLTLDTAKAQLAAQQPVSGPLPAGVTVDATIPTVASISFRPNPIGIGQTLIVNMWVTPGVSSNNRLFPQALHSYNNRARWNCR